MSKKTVTVNGRQLSEEQTRQLFSDVSKTFYVKTIEGLELFLIESDFICRENDNTNELKIFSKTNKKPFYIVDLD